MIVKPDNLNEICVVFLILFILEIILNYLLESVNNKLLFESRIRFLSMQELFVGFVFVFSPLKMKKCIRQTEFSTPWIFSYACLIHTVELFY